MTTTPEDDEEAACSTCGDRWCDGCEECDAECDAECECCSGCDNAPWNCDCDDDEEDKTT